MKFKTTKNTISIGTQIHESKIMEAKMYLKKHFNNEYDVDPHFNFIIMAMPESSLNEMEKTLDALFASKPPLVLKFGELHYEPKNKFFSIPIIGDEVMGFHKELIDILNPLRGNYIREKDLVRINDQRTDQEETENIYKYGYLRVLNKFHPHITIGNLQTEGDVNINEITNELNELLSGLYNNILNVKELYATFIEDANIQSEYKWLWEKEYKLN